MLPTLTDLLKKLESGDRVFLRGDLNVPLKNGMIQDTNRLEAILPTLNDLLQAGAVITLATHLGRPKGIDPDLSTRH
ncbi:MAG: phosphoglycerate kinase, partial [Planctomycetota bacterium]